MISKSITNKLIDIARANILLPDSGKRHFSFIMDGKKIISFGWNRSWRTHPIAKRYGHRHDCQHSELHAILNFQYPIRELRWYDLVNIRLHKNGNVALSKPCNSCQEMLADFGVSNIFFSAQNGEFVKLW
jgi:deoxycytidylate deaminase